MVLLWFSAKVEPTLRRLPILILGLLGIFATVVGEPRTKKGRQRHDAWHNSSNRGLPLFHLGGFEVVSWTNSI